MPNQEGPSKRARRASPTERPRRRPSRHAGRRRAEHVALAAHASCGPRRKNRTRRFAGLLLVLVALILLVPQLPGQSGDDPALDASHWKHNAPVAHQNAARSGSIEIGLDSNETELLWQHTTDQPFLAGAVMDEKRVYTVDRGGNITARSVNTGDAVWTHALEEEVAATPALNYGWLYVATLDGNVYALERSSGTVMQESSLSGPARAASLVTQGRLFQGTEEGILHVLDAGSLSEMWRFDTAATFHNGSADGEDTDLRAAVRAPPAVHEGRVFVSAWNGWVYAMDIAADENGEPTHYWQKEVGDRVQAGPVVDRYNDRVIVPTKVGRLLALDTADGSTKWQSEETAAFIGGVALDDTQVLARTSDADLISLDAKTGKKQWTHHDPSGHLAAPILLQDLIVQASGNGTLSLLSRTTGEPLPNPETRDALARWELPGAIHAPPAVTSRGIAVVDHAGTTRLYGVPPHYVGDLEALSIRTTAIGIGPEMDLELAVKNHGPDPVPEIRVRIERNGALHKEEVIEGIPAEEETRWEFRFTATPGEHELEVSFLSLGATDPDPERAQITRSFTLEDRDPQNQTDETDEAAAPAPSSTFTEGLRTGLGWAAIPGTILGIVAGVLIAKRLRSTRGPAAPSAPPTA